MNIEKMVLSNLRYFVGVVLIILVVSVLAVPVALPIQALAKSVQRTVPTGDEFEERFGVRPEGQKAVEALQPFVTKRLQEDWLPCSIAQLRVWDLKTQTIKGSDAEQMRHSNAVFEAMLHAGQVYAHYEREAWLAEGFGFEVQNLPVGFRI